MGVTSQEYKCLDDGTYATPKGKEEGDPWPECTLKPVDPSKSIPAYSVTIIIKLVGHRGPFMISFNFKVHSFLEHT